MNQEYGIQQAERVSQVPVPLVEYIDQKIASLDRKMNNMGRKDGAAREFIDVVEAQQERVLLQKKKDDLLNGQYTGIATLLQVERAQAEQKLASLQQQICPRSTDPSRDAMQNDGFYFAMQENIMHEQRILVKAAGVLDQDDKTYIESKIKKYKTEQSYRTERGGVLSNMERTQGWIKSVGSLQQLVPRPAAK